MLKCGAVVGRVEIPHGGLRNLRFLLVREDSEKITRKKIKKIFRFAIDERQKVLYNTIDRSL